MTERIQELERLLELVKKPSTILLVDDDRDFCELMKEFFKQEKFEMETVYSGEEALSKIEEGYKPDVVLLDLRLTGMDGVEVFRRIREKDANLPVAFFTGASDDQRLLEVSKYGWAAIIPKPANVNELQHIVGVLAHG